MAQNMASTYFGKHTGDTRKTWTSAFGSLSFVFRVTSKNLPSLKLCWPGKRPVLVFIHGGFLISGSVADYYGKLNYMARCQGQSCDSSES